MKWQPRLVSAEKHALIPDTIDVVFEIDGTRVHSSFGLSLDGISYADDRRGFGFGPTAKVSLHHWGSTIRVVEPICFCGPIPEGM
jgi:hypothetical protein